MDYLLDRLPDVVLVAAIGTGAYAIVLALLLIAAQLAAASRRADWPTYLIASAGLFVIWALIR